MEASVTMLISGAGHNSGFALGKKAHNSAAGIQKLNILMVMHLNNKAVLQILRRNGNGLRLSLKILKDICVGLNLPCLHYFPASKLARIQLILA